MNAKSTKVTATSPASLMAVSDNVPTKPKLSPRDRALAAFEKAVEKDTKKLTQDELARMKAFGDTMPAAVAEADEETRAIIFFLFEFSATTSNARRIASHPLRPAAVDEMLDNARADAAAAKAAEEAEKARVLAVAAKGVADTPVA